ncbi:MAG: tRNA (guanosine(46)-N7)-methyltransferase TrmB [Anaerolineaceae bacterium]|nr:tRNA (guanosine(46)-N7)-methyltransferase TrmB [Anaerolineaceae bacterium]
MQKLSGQQLPWPVDWAVFFGTVRPLILEIGFGHGQYLVHLAERYPDHHIIGMEVASRCLQAAEGAIERQRSTNVLPIHATAEMALHHLFEPETISQIHINFPDPWFKHKHGHRRLMQRDTLDAMVSRLVTGGKLFLATDIRAYAEMSSQLLASTRGLDNLLPAPWMTAMPERGITTRYEAKALKMGETCHYFAYQRNMVPVTPLPVIKELAMPHIVFKTPLSLETMMAQFEPSEFAEGDTIIRFLNVYRGERALLLEIYVKEPTIEQRAAFLVADRPEPGEFTLKLSALGHPRPTVGIHRAAALLGDWLIGLDPANVVLKRSLLE